MNKRIKKKFRNRNNCRNYSSKQKYSFRILVTSYGSLIRNLRLFDLPYDIKVSLNENVNNTPTP